MKISRSSAFGAPSRYIQGYDEIYRLPTHTKKFGTKLFAIIDVFFYKKLSTELQKLYEEEKHIFQAVCFENEITEKKIQELAQQMQGTEVLVGIGGGKTVDTAKAVADILNVPLVIMPTSASSDAPTSAMSIVYKENHERSHCIMFNKNPDLVLVDSKIIAHAPVRSLVAGMGDALATHFEALASYASNSPNYICCDVDNFRSTRVGMAISKLCYETVIKYGVDAKIANENNVVTESLEAVIEANILMSGLGFENTGCSIAHGVSNGLSATSKGGVLLHGEKVAFGLLCQLLAENVEAEILNEYIEFSLKVGLPLTFEDLDLEMNEENLKIIVENTTYGEIEREPFNLTPPMLKDIIIFADAIGAKHKVKKA